VSRSIRSLLASTLAAFSLLGAASLPLACGSNSSTANAGDGGPFASCTPGGDGSYVTTPFQTLDQYCLVALADGPGGTGRGDVVYQSAAVPYELRSPLFSDYATKSRAVFVPAGKTASYDADGVFDFPTGTVLLKSFGFPADARVTPPEMHWLETRLLVRADDGWHAYPYLWNEDGTTATYDPGGRALHVSWTDADGGAIDHGYLQPGQTQCKQCHESAGNFEPIGPKARNLNRDHDYGGGVVENQLVHWTNAGILAGAPADPSAAPVLADWTDTTQSIDTRARAYLEANCAHCHNATGSASTSGLFLSASVTDALHYGVCKEPLSAGGMVGNRQFDVVPGDPDASVLSYRMSVTDPGVAMPQIGRDVVDTDGLALVRTWIMQLPKAPCSK
jgi:uncharacterized repeat protein (TIGR03806 family)